MNVDQIMHRDVVTIGMDDQVEVARALFVKHRFHHLLVIDGTALVGIVSDRDLLSHVSPFIGKLSERPQDMATLHRHVHQVMSHHPVTVTPDTSLHDAVELMLSRGISCLPVVTAEHRILGVVTTRDLLRGLCGTELPSQA